MTSHELAPTTAGTLTLAGPTRWQAVAGAWLLTFASENTRTAYRRDLLQAAAYLAGLGIPDPLAAPRPAVDAYARHLEELQLAPASRARKIASLASFYNYAATEGLLDRNPAAHTRRPSVSTSSPRLGMNADQARRLVAAAEVLGPEYRALVALLLGAGLRVSEALSVTATDLAEEAGHRVVRVVGKGGRHRTVPLSAPAWALLLPAVEAATDPTAPLIRGPRGGSIDRHRALRMVEALGKAAGLEHPLRPHDCRHTAATLALNAGAPIHRVQDLLGHASPTTTQRYVAHRERLENSAAYTLGAVLGGAL